MQILNGGNKVYENHLAKITFATNDRHISDIAQLPNAYMKLVNSESLEVAAVPLIIETVGVDFSKMSQEELITALGEFMHNALIDTFLATFNFQLPRALLNDIPVVNGQYAPTVGYQYALGTLVEHAMSKREVQNILVSEENEFHKLRVNLGHGLEFRTLDPLSDADRPCKRFGKCKLFGRQYDFQVRRIHTAFLRSDTFVGLHNYTFDPAMMQNLIMEGVEKQFPFLTLQEYFSVEEFYTLKPDTEVYNLI